MSIAVGAHGRLFASVYHRGIYRSLDTGTTWHQVAPYTDGIWSIAIRSNGEIIASLWSRGIFRSTDHGGTWLPFAAPKRHADVRAVNSAGAIFIESAGRMYRSTPAETSWTELPIHGGALGVYGSSMVAVKGTVCYRSIDDGNEWNSVSPLPAPAYAVAAGPSGAVFAGMYVDPFHPLPAITSFDSASAAWTGSGPSTTINAIVRRNDGVLLAASHDSGFYFSTTNGATWLQNNIGLTTPKIYSLALLNDTLIVAGTANGIFFSSHRLSALNVSSTQPPAGFRLEQNFPNPFNPTTVIRFSLSVSGRVEVSVRDLLGRTHAVLVDAWRDAGEHEIQFDGASLSSGYYLYTLRSGSVSVTRSMLLLR
ncbi:MAG: T9SS type A sorting domain-containing protein [Bacteroidetes bacterium]|nr:T9SS type A sorting domain-containing protein [Bacteroidota bacterium]